MGPDCRNGMPERVNEELFLAMSKALDFIDTDKLSMTVVLTAMNRFARGKSPDGSRPSNPEELVEAPIR